MKCLGLRLNLKKSELSPSQRTTFLGLVWDSTTMQAHLSPVCVHSILNTVTKQGLLGLVAPAANGIPMGLLHIKPFQFWLKSRGFHPLHHPSRVIRIMRCGLCALQLWKRPWFLNRGMCCHRKSLMTDTSLRIVMRFLMAKQPVDFAGTLIFLGT